MKIINWKKGFFSSKYRLFENNIEIGEFKQSSFGSTSHGKIKGANIQFKKKGAFNSETDITDVNTNQSIGSIKFNGWRSKAEITIHNKKYQWKYENFWHSKWSISENEKQVMFYYSSSSTGRIESFIENDLLLLCGFYVYNYYTALMVIIAASTAIIVSGN